MAEYRNDHGADVDPHDLEMVAFRSTPEGRARDALRAVNADMRRNYAALKGELTTHLTPVIVVQNDARGGRYTLVDGGERESLHPVPEVFELAKSIAHVPLGVYTILAPHLTGPEGLGWVRPLQDFAETLTAARQRLPAAGLPRELEASSRRILDGALRFVAGSVEHGTFSTRSFTEFTGAVYGDVRTTMRHAARAQITGVEAVMRRWRRRVGEERWPDLYVVVLSLWTTSVLNQNSIIIERFMAPAAAPSHLIDLPTAEPPADPVATALDNLARIVQDNVAAELVFPADQEIADALKGREDLLSDAIQEQLACPYRDGRAAGAAAGGKPVERPAGRAVR
ncbi:hypothetical protein ACFP3U_00150 [Kitasatospora misakiensis]|uniref:Uncharacterized protein n=1 Tax=Kitasatospora misakiensis TaxID=67330 RepID=A0ABW0WXJ9_9ACTN